MLEGKLEGLLEGERKKAIAIAENLLLKLPTFSDQEIADLSGVAIKDIKALRLKIARKKSKTSKK